MMQSQKPAGIEQTRPAPRSASLIPLALLLVAIFGVWVQNRTRPYVGHDDWANIDCCLSVARNFQRYGLLASRFAQNRTLYDAPPAERRYMYTSAPLRSVFAYGSLETFGDNAFSPRFTALMFAMVGAACLYAFTRRVADRRTAALALVFFAFCPMMVYYSAKLDPQIFGMPSILLTLILYWRWSRHPERRAALALFALAVLGALFTRRWYVFAGVLALHALAFHRWRGVWRMWPVWAGTLAGGLAWVGIGLWGMPGFAAGLMRGFERRALTNPAQPITDFWRVVGVNAVTSLTPTLLILAALGLWFMARRRGSSAHDRMLLTVLPVTLLLYNSVFWKSTYYHVFAILIGVLAFAPLAAIGYLGLLHLSEDPSPAWRAAVGTLLLTFFAASVRWSLALHGQVTPQYYTWGTAIHAATREGERVAANITHPGPFIGYYADRALDYEVDPDVLAQPDRGGYGFYLYCAGASPEAVDVAGLSGATVVLHDEGSDCWLIDLE